MHWAKNPILLGNSADTHEIVSLSIEWTTFGLINFFEKSALNESES